VSRWSDIQVIALQLGAAVATTIGGLAIATGVAVWLPAIAVLVVAYVGITLRQRAGQVVDRAAVRALSRRSAAVFAALGALAYAGAWWWSPGAFDFPPRALLGLAPAMGLGAGFAAFVLTLCGADLAASSGAP
jgi:hypothetical protein